MNRDILDTADSFLSEVDDVLYDFGAKRAFEANYGNEAITLEQLPGAFL